MGIKIYFRYIYCAFYFLIPFSFVIVSTAKEESSEEDFDESQKFEKIIARLTDNYRLSYKEVKDDLLFKQAPLSSIDKKRVMQIISVGRKKLTRKSSSVNGQDITAAAQDIVGKKRGNSKGAIHHDIMPPSKRQQLGKILTPP